MTAKPASRLVYSTASRACPKCGWPEKSCRCSGSFDEAVPGKIVVKLRLEKAGRGGKTVTVADGLPKNRDFLKQLVGELKKTCGSGGTAGETSVEIQGDHLDTLRRVLASKGWTVKG